LEWSGGRKGAEEDGEGISEVGRSRRKRACALALREGTAHPRRLIAKREVKEACTGCRHLHPGELELQRGDERGREEKNTVVTARNV